jgi:peptidoglycan hydrolase-like protein with peptidoglycan-binding domain
MVVLRRGAKGEDVKRLQALLRSHGFPNLAVDGDFGPATEAAVRRFQSEHKLVVDGVAGPQTWAALGATDPHEQRIKQAVSFFSPSYSVRPNGAVHQWREDPPRELSVDSGS